MDVVGLVESSLFTPLGPSVTFTGSSGSIFTHTTAMNITAPFRFCECTDSHISSNGSGTPGKTKAENDAPRKRLLLPLALPSSLSRPIPYQFMLLPQKIA